MGMLAVAHTRVEGFGESMRKPSRQCCASNASVRCLGLCYLKGGCQTGEWCIGKVGIGSQPATSICYVSRIRGKVQLRNWIGWWIVQWEPAYINDGDDGFQRRAVDGLDGLAGTLSRNLQHDDVAHWPSNIGDTVLY